MNSSGSEEFKVDEAFAALREHIETGNKALEAMAKVIEAQEKTNKANAKKLETYEQNFNKLLKVSERTAKNSEGSFQKLYNMEIRGAKGPKIPMSSYGLI